MVQFTEQDHFSDRNTLASVSVVIIKWPQMKIRLLKLLNNLLCCNIQLF